ncbi:MAG: DNA-directed RNA polymerase [Candidatus Altiarchaeota archaeon]|nr:DNA-directed RNA polymerase [Candidatus Altiarchaeota archaeon]
MFELVTFKQNVRVPPSLWKDDIKEATRQALKDLEGQVSRMEGMLLSILEIQTIGEGKILPGDGAVYFPATYKALMFNPEMNEVIDGEISDMVEFGAFVRVGPMDGLVHISQIADDFFSYSESGVIQGKQSKKIIKTNDTVRSRIISISHKAEPAKLGVTMRQPGLGKHEWLEEEKGE